jgi:hypothetical protein
MSITNDFLPFATGGGANVEAQATYASDTTRTNGNQPGIASSALNNKALRQGSVIASQIAQYVGNIANVNVLDDGDTTKLLQIITASLQRLPPVISKYTTGSGNHNLTWYFFIASGNATSGATYTNNGVTYTVSATIAAGTLLQATGNAAPTTSGTLTKASGTGDATLTFYAVRSCIMMEVTAIGGGGGGGGSGTAGNVTGGTGGNTTFGTTLIVASGGPGGTGGGSGSSAGGAASLGGLTGIAAVGNEGGAPSRSIGAFNGAMGGPLGGSSAFGGAGGSAYGANPGHAATAYGAGGGGGGADFTASNNFTGGGGSAGGFVKAYITSPLYTYAYSIGAGGTAGTGGSSGGAGGAGFAGVVLVIEHFQ